MSDRQNDVLAAIDAGVTIGILDENGRVHTEAPAVSELEWFQRSLMTRGECARALAQMPARVASVREAAQEWEDAYEQMRAATLLTPEQLGPLLNRLHDMGNALPESGEDFRRRALEARQNRGTGPAERRQRLPRNHRG